MSNLSIEQAGEYYTCINVLKARNALDLNNSTSWPHMKPADRTKSHNRLLKQAGLVQNKHKALTAQDVAKIIGK